MLKENWRTISRIQRFGDFTIIIIAFFIAYYGRGSLLFWDEAFSLGLPFSGKQLAPIKDYFIVLGVALTGYGVMLQVLGAYDSMRLRSSFELFWMSVVSSVVTFLLLAASLFLLKIDLSRSFIGLFCILVCFSLSAERAMVLELLRYWRRRGLNFRRLIIVGVGKQAKMLAMEIAARPELGIRVRGFADLAADKNGSPAQYAELRSELKAKDFHFPLVESFEEVKRWIPR